MENKDNLSEECVDLTPKEDSIEYKLTEAKEKRANEIVKNVELQIARIEAERKNRSLPRKIFDKSYDFLRDNGDFLLYTSSAAFMAVFSANAAIENMNKDPNLATGYGALSLALAFTTGVFFERYRPK